MRNRYVKKCKCDSNPTVKKRTTSLKGVLDIDIEVVCSECGRPYKEVPPKRTRMENPDILVETVEVNGDEPPVYDIGAEDDRAGELQQETESTEGRGQEKEPVATAPEEKDKVTEPEDPGRDFDEGTTEDKVEEKKEAKRGRPRGKAAGNKPVDAPVYEKTTEEALADDGVPKEDLF